MSSDSLAIDGGTPVRTARLPLHTSWFDAREQKAMLDVAGMSCNMAARA